MLLELARLLNLIINPITYAEFYQASFLEVKVGGNEETGEYSVA